MPDFQIHPQLQKDCFVLVNYESINFPESLITIVTSAAQNAVVGVSVNSNNEVSSFQAINE